MSVHGILGKIAAIAQLVERIHGKDEVLGSNPSRGSNIMIYYQVLALTGPAGID